MSDISKKIEDDIARRIEHLLGDGVAVTKREVAWFDWDRYEHDRDEIIAYYGHRNAYEAQRAGVELPATGTYRREQPLVSDLPMEIDSLYELVYALESSEDFGVDMPGVGTLVYVERYGGEGEGDQYWCIFKVGDRFFKIDGHYQSYSGGEYDEIYEVVGKQVMKTEWERTSK